jgi:hypothetical protein
MRTQSESEHNATENERQNVREKTAKRIQTQSKSKRKKTHYNRGHNARSPLEMRTFRNEGYVRHRELMLARTQHSAYRRIEQYSSALNFAHLVVFHGDASCYRWGKG